MILIGSKGKTISHIKQIYITPSTILEQSDRVARSKFNLHAESDYELINIEVLRSKAGQFWVKEISKIVEGEEVFEYKWKPMINPPIIYLDESQKAKKCHSQSNSNNLPSICRPSTKQHTCIIFCYTIFYCCSS